MLSEKLDSDIESVLDGTFPSDKSEVYIGEISNFLTDVIGAQSKVNLMPVNKLYAAIKTKDEAKKEGRYQKQLNYHGLGKEKFMATLAAAEKPIAAVASKKDENGKPRNNRIMLITGEVDSKGDNIVVIEQVDSKGLKDGKRVEANRVITVYDKSYIQGVVIDTVADDAVLYFQKNKISTIARSEEVQFLNSRSGAYFNNNIDNFWANVNYEKAKIEKRFSLPENPTDKIADETAVYDYIDENETIFTEVLPIKN